MEVPQAITLRQLSEQKRRTNILLQELGRPTIDLNMVANETSLEDLIPLSCAILKDDEESISRDSDEGSAERFYGKQPPNLKPFKDGDSFADWLTTFVISELSLFSAMLFASTSLKDTCYSLRGIPRRADRS